MANVLVVDDSSTVRNELGDFLTKNGFKVALAVDRLTELYARATGWLKDRFVDS